MTALGHHQRGDDRQQQPRQICAPNIPRPVFWRFAASDFVWRSSFHSRLFRGAPGETIRRRVAAAPHDRGAFARARKISSSEGLSSSTIRAPVRFTGHPAVPSSLPLQSTVHCVPRPDTKARRAGRVGLVAASRIARPGGDGCPGSPAGGVERDPPMVQQRHPVGDALDFVEQMRRKQDRSPLVGHRADDGRQNVAANHRVEATRRLVENQQIGSMGQGSQQARPGTLAPRQPFDLLFGVQLELVPQLVGEALRPKPDRMPGCNASTARWSSSRASRDLPTGSRCGPARRPDREPDRGRTPAPSRTSV